MSLEKRKALLTLIGRPKKIASKKIANKAGLEGEGLREQINATEDRKYPYKFLHCRDLAFGKGQLGAGIMEDVQNHQINASEFYANYFATK